MVSFLPLFLIEGRGFDNLFRLVTILNIGWM